MTLKNFLVHRDSGPIDCTWLLEGALHLALLTSTLNASFKLLNLNRLRRVFGNNLTIVILDRLHHIGDDSWVPLADGLIELAIQHGLLHFELHQAFGEVLLDVHHLTDLCGRVSCSLGNYRPEIFRVRHIELHETPTLTGRQTLRSETVCPGARPAGTRKQALPGLAIKGPWIFAHILEQSEHPTVPGSSCTTRYIRHTRLVIPEHQPAQAFLQPWHNTPEAPISRCIELTD